jgi:ribonuclease G
MAFLKKKRKVEEGCLTPVGREIAVAVYPDETRVAVLENGCLVEIDVERTGRRSMVGDIYLGRVENVLPGMEAAFVNVGQERNALLYVGDIFVEGDAAARRPDIKELLKPGQKLMVQVSKDPMGSKGARLTTYISLAGRYLVLLPQASNLGVSQKLHPEERQRLREMLEGIKPPRMGLIVRTAAQGQGEKELRRDLDFLMRKWKEIGAAAGRSKAPCLLYREPELEVRVVRDLLSEEWDRVVTDSLEAAARLREYLRSAAPRLEGKVVLYQGREPLFKALDINRQIKEALRREVPLPSGGSIVIDPTEALTAIDVNTGRFVGRSNLEDTVLRTNLEAAREVVRQLRLRDIGGIIVIDFIDMIESRNRREVLEVLEAELEKDRTKSFVVELSRLGLVEMTRKNVSEGLIEAFGETCPMCRGRGVIFREP